MKKVLIVLLLVLLILLPTSIVFAHPGQTDSNGGHYDRSTGEYHYHHGYPAHQHTNGSCPYDFDDKTGENSGTSSSSNFNTEQTTSTISVNEASNTSNVVSSKELSAFEMKVIIVLSVIVIILIIINYFSSSRCKAYQNKISTLEEECSSLCKQLFRSKSELRILNQKFAEAGKEIPDISTLEKIAGVPENIKFDKDNLPYLEPIDTQSPWGCFTVYVSHNGTRMHRNHGCSGAYRPMHVYNAIKWGYTPCRLCFVSTSYCNTQIPDWYIEYCKLKEAES